MRRCCTILCLALLGFVCAALGRDITTLSGQSYQDVTVTRIEATGFSITHRDGIAFVEFANLSPAVLGELAGAEAAPGVGAAPGGGAALDGAAPPAEFAYAAQITTLDGSVYRDVTITRVEPTGLRVSHADGVGFIDFLTLPEPVRTRYGYGEAKYTAGRALLLQREHLAAEAQRRLAAQRAARDAAAQAEQAEFARRETAIVKRDYSTTDYTHRDYGTDRYTGGDNAGAASAGSSTTTDTPTNVNVQQGSYYRRDGTYILPFRRLR